MNVHIFSFIAMGNHHILLCLTRTQVTECDLFLRARMGDTVGAGIIERKLRSTKVRLFTVPCSSIILFSSEGVKKNVSEFNYS